MRPQITLKVMLLVVAMCAMVCALMFHQPGPNEFYYDELVPAMEDADLGGGGAVPPKDRPRTPRPITP